MTTSPPPPSLARRALAVLVGLFAVWQLVFLPAANLIDFVPRRIPPPLEPIGDTYQQRGTFTTVEPLQAAADGAGVVLDFWSEASGQEQGWSLFPPGVPPYSVIPAVEFRFADGSTATVLSAHEPADKLDPQFRTILINDRAFNVESQLAFSVWYAAPEEVARLYVPPEEMADLPAAYRLVPGTARTWRPVARAYLAWRLREYAAANPDRPRPTEVVLKHRFIPIPKPGAPRGWGTAVERPYARWTPATDAYDVYDILAGRFVPAGGAP